MNGVDSFRGIDRLIGSVKRVLLTRYSFDDMRLLFGEIASDYSNHYGNTDGDWIVDDGCFDPVRFRSQFAAQTYAALRNSSMTCNHHRAAFLPLPPSDSD